MLNVGVLDLENSLVSCAHQRKYFSSSGTNVERKRQIFGSRIRTPSEAIFLGGVRSDREMKCQTMIRKPHALQQSELAQLVAWLLFC